MAPSTQTIRSRAASSPTGRELQRFVGCRTLECSQDGAASLENKVQVVVKVNKDVLGEGKRHALPPPKKKAQGA